MKCLLRCKSNLNLLSKFIITGNIIADPFHIRNQYAFSVHQFIYFRNELKIRDENCRYEKLWLRSALRNDVEQRKANDTTEPATRMFNILFIFSKNNHKPRLYGTQKGDRIIYCILSLLRLWFFTQTMPAPAWIWPGDSRWGADVRKNGVIYGS